MLLHIIYPPLYSSANMELSFFFMSFSFSLPMFHLLLIISTFTFRSAQPLCHKEDRIALLQLKRSFPIAENASTDPSSYPKVASWTSQEKSDCCSWDGVECDEDTGHVISLNLNSSCLYGSINSSNSLFRLSQLQSLNLADNHFNYSQIPHKLGNLSRLVYLNLSCSLFYGQIPSEISQLFSLTSLDLSSNLDIHTDTPLLKLKSPNFDTFARNLSNLKQLSLSYVDISSPVPSFLVNLSSLASLQMSNCGLNGEFPAGIFQLPNLKFLDLTMNQDLTGHLPEFQFGSPLKVLILSQTSFSGKIPSSIGNLTKLTILDLLENNLTGLIPPHLGNLTELTFLSLESNKFYGPVPESFSRLKKLQTLSLFSNELGGTVDFDMFFNMTHLTTLQLSENNFSVLTNNMANINATNAPKFEILEMAFCNLDKFPEFLRNQDSLVFLTLEHNHIHGKIPKWMWNTSVKTLESLYLSGNSFTGFEQPPSVLPWIRLVVLNLDHNMINGPLVHPPPSIKEYHASTNNFSGEISPLFCNLSFLESLDLSNNKLTGMLPECLENQSVSLTVLNLGNNQFHGRIPGLCPSISSLKLIDLSDNMFHGNLPRSLVYCIELEVLALNNNQLDDVFPYHLGTLQELKILILESNRLHGVINNHISNFGFPSLHIIDLSHNSFSGLFPSEFFKNLVFMKSGEMGNTSYMQAETNFDAPTTAWMLNYSYSANIMNKGRTLAYEKIQEAFVVIDFSSNNFEGKIPNCIGDLKRLQVLSLSNNVLTGSIPLSFAKMMNLESLDLSRNKLSGRIPQQLKQLTFLEYLNVSENQLTGPIPKGNQFDTFGSSSYQGNLGLCGDPLPKKCDNIESSTPQDHEETRSKSVFASNWMTIVPGYVCGLLVGVAIEWSFSRKMHERIANAFFRFRLTQNRRRGSRGAGRRT